MTGNDRDLTEEEAAAEFKAYLEMADRPEEPVAEEHRQTPKRVAFHESGHAVVAARLGQTVLCISIEGFEDGARGRVCTTSPDGEDPLTNVIVLLSGNPAGNLSGDQLTGGTVDYERDEEEAWRQVRKRFPVEQVNIKFGYARQKAEGLVSENAATIERLAMALLARVRIDGHDEIVRIMNGAEQTPS